MKKKDILNAEENEMVVELTDSYGIEPEEVMFFEGDPKPFLSYEATCALCNQLLNPRDIEIVPVPSVNSDSISLKCTLVFNDGRSRSSVGVVNLNEQIDTVLMNDGQRHQLASARAIRNALKTANIDLIKLHYAAKGEVLSFRSGKSDFASSISQAHILGSETGFISGKDKTAWYALLRNRYQVEHCNELSQIQMADFTAFLSSLLPQSQQAAQKAA